MIKQILWRKAYDVQDRQRDRYWADVRCDAPGDPEEMTLLYAVVKEFDGHTIIHEHLMEDDQCYLLATTRHHLRDQLFQEFYEARLEDVVRTHRRLTMHNNRSYVTVYTLKDPQDL